MNTKQETLILDQFKKDLMDKAVAGILDTDISSWNIDQWYSQAKTKVSKTDEYMALESIDRLSHLVSEHDVEAAFEKLMLTDSSMDDENADEILDMWEPLAHYFTIGALREYIHL